MSGNLPVALTIAGFDPSGGAGITADLAVFAAHGLYGTSAATVLTAQSTQGVAGSRAIEPEFLRQTLTVLTGDLPPAGVKIGALGSPAIATEVAGFLATLPRTVVRVFDPVLLSSSGFPLFPVSSVATLTQDLLDAVDWLTPNWAELALLSGLPVGTPEEAVYAARALSRRHAGLSLVVTAGDQKLTTDLVLEPTGVLTEIPGIRLESTSTHGTGCAFSSALLANLIHGQAPVEAVRAAKHFVEEGIRRAPGLGHGRGPLDLYWPLRGR